MGKYSITQLTNPIDNGFVEKLTVQKRYYYIGRGMNLGLTQKFPDLLLQFLHMTFWFLTLCKQYITQYFSYFYQPITAQFPHREFYSLSFLSQIQWTLF